jgi:hypothetical protein
MPPTTSTPSLVLVADTMTEMRIGAMSLQIRSILLIDELRWVKSYGRPPGAATVTTQSLSMDNIFPEALRFSRIPKRRMKANIASFRIDGVRIPPRDGPDVAPSGRLVPGSTMKNHSTEAPMTANLLMDIVLRSVLNRSGF